MADKPFWAEGVKTDAVPSGVANWNKAKAKAKAKPKAKAKK